jgi:hypothetical protein
MNPRSGFPEKSNNPCLPKTKVELMITIAMLKKLMLTKSVANKRLGVLNNNNIFLSVAEVEDFSSSMSVGVSEKKADSAADTTATTSNIISIAKIAKRVLTEKVLIVT